MAEDQEESEVFRLFGVDICVPKSDTSNIILFGVDICIPKSDTSNVNNHKKQLTIEVEPNFLDDDDCEYKNQKANQVEDLSGMNVEAVGWFDQANFIASTLKGNKIELIIEKSLLNADLNSHQGRLSMPKNQTLIQFLTKEEEDLLEDKKNMAVTVIDPCLRCYELSLGRWNYYCKKNKKGNNESKPSWSYVLINGWNKLREANVSVLQVSEVIQVWSFRIQDKLGLAIIRI